MVKVELGKLIETDDKGLTKQKFDGVRNDLEKGLKDKSYLSYIYKGDSSSDIILPISIPTAKGEDKVTLQNGVREICGHLYVLVHNSQENIEGIDKMALYDSSEKRRDDDDDDDDDDDNDYYGFGSKRCYKTMKGFKLKKGGKLVTAQSDEVNSKDIQDDKLKGTNLTKDTQQEDTQQEGTQKEGTQKEDTQKEDTQKEGTQKESGASWAKKMKDENNNKDKGTYTFTEGCRFHGTIKGKILNKTKFVNDQAKLSGVFDTNKADFKPANGKAQSKPLSNKKLDGTYKGEFEGGFISSSGRDISGENLEAEIAESLAEIQTYIQQSLRDINSLEDYYDYKETDEKDEDGNEIIEKKVKEDWKPFFSAVDLVTDGETPREPKSDGKKFEGKVSKGEVDLDSSIPHNLQRGENTDKLVTFIENLSKACENLSGEDESVCYTEFKKWINVGINNDGMELKKFIEEKEALEKKELIEEGAKLSLPEYDFLMFFARIHGAALNLLRAFEQEELESEIKDQSIRKNQMHFAKWLLRYSAANLPSLFGSKGKPEGESDNDVMNVYDNNKFISDYQMARARLRTLANVAIGGRKNENNEAKRITNDKGEIKNITNNDNEKNRRKLIDIFDKGAVAHTYEVNWDNYFYSELRKLEDNDDDGEQSDENNNTWLEEINEYINKLTNDVGSIVGSGNIRDEVKKVMKDKTLMKQVDGNNESDSTIGYIFSDAIKRDGPVYEWPKLPSVEDLPKNNEPSTAQSTGGTSNNVQIPIKTDNEGSNNVKERELINQEQSELPIKSMKAEPKVEDVIKAIEKDPSVDNFKYQWMGMRAALCTLYLLAGEKTYFTLEERKKIMAAGIDSIISEGDQILYANNSRGMQRMLPWYNNYREKVEDLASEVLTNKCERLRAEELLGKNMISTALKIYKKRYANKFDLDYVDGKKHIFAVDPKIMSVVSEHIHDAI